MSDQNSAESPILKRRVVILLGPPGVGKGTQAQRIAGKYGLKHLSTGDMLRENVRRGTELAREAEPFMDRGELVPDDIMVGIVRNVITQDCDKGFILDGFPRTLAQAEGLERICGLYKLRSTSVLNMVVRPELLMRRLTSRRICKMSGHIYSVVYNPPIKAGICDIDGSELVQRLDDTEAVISERMAIYEYHTSPLINYYSARGLLHDVDGIADPDEVMANIMKCLEKKDFTRQSNVIGS